MPPATEKRPFWVSEFLTVIEGKKGTQTETNALIARDKSESTDVITRNGQRLLEEARSTLEHIAGDTSKSLQLVPTIYFYSEGGAPLRGLLYGFLYWLTNGNDTDVNERKRIFSAYRRPFEDVLLGQKKDLTIRFGRGIGSGSEITTQWANYLNSLLDLMIKCRGDLSNESFAKGYQKIRESLPHPKSAKTETDEVSARIFNNRQKSALALEQIHKGLAVCGICGGYLDPTRTVQHDHVVDFAEGGKTSADNQALAHPYCNRNKKGINAIQTSSEVSLPYYMPFDASSGLQMRLEFINDSYFSE